MDYDTDEKSMATLRRQLRRAREEYYRYKRYGLLAQFKFFFVDCHSLLMRHKIVVEANRSSDEHSS